MPSQKVATTDGHLGVRIELELAVRRVDTPAEADANSLSPLGGVANVLGTTAGENGKIGSLEYTDAAPAHSFPRIHSMAMTLCILSVSLPSSSLRVSVLGSVGSSQVLL